MYIHDIVRRSSRSLLSARARTLLTALAIAVGAFALTLTLGASNGAQRYANIIVKNNFDPSELIVTADGSLFSNANETKPKVYSPNFGSALTAGGDSRQIKMLNDGDVVRLQKTPGVASVRTVSTVSLQYATRDGQKKYVATAQAFNSYQTPELLAGAVDGTLTDKSLILPEQFLPALGFSTAKAAVGQPVRLAVRKQADQSSALSSLLSGGSLDEGKLTSNTSKETVFTVAAVSKEPSTLIQQATALYLTLNEDDLVRLSDYATSGTTNYHKYLTTYVKVADGTDSNKLNAAQARIKKEGYSAQSVVDTQKIITQVISVLQGIVTVFGLIAVVASVFGVVNTMYISVLQRTREIGLMKALGMHKKDINKLFLFEAGLIGFLGGLLGSVAAVLLGIGLNPSISSWLKLGNVHLIEFKLFQIVFLVAALTLVAIIAGLFPARKAARLDPIAALRTE